MESRNASDKREEKVAEKTKKSFFIKRTDAHLNHLYVYLNIEKELIAPLVGFGVAVKGCAETRPLTRGEEKTEDPPSTSPQHSPHIDGKKLGELLMEKIDEEFTQLFLLIFLTSPFGRFLRHHHKRFFPVALIYTSHSIFSIPLSNGLSPKVF
jgi:hypothetical protein